MPDKTEDKKAVWLSDTEEYKGLCEQPHGGYFGILKFGDFQVIFAAYAREKIIEKDDSIRQVMDKIKKMFADVGEQLAVSYKDMKDKGKKTDIVEVTK